MKRIVVFVNRLEEIGFRQTTALLIASFNRKGCDVLISGVDGLSIQSTGTQLHNICGSDVPKQCVTSEQIEAFVRSDPEQVLVPISGDDLVLIRTNPGRDLERHALHRSLLELAEIVESLGTSVINSPCRLPFFGSKLSLAALPRKFRPAMVVSNRPEEICQFVERASGDCVVKPLVGSRGANVIRVNRMTEDLRARLVELFDGTMMLAQRFVHAQHSGDRRVVVLDGQILESKGHIAGIERHPAANDFRANLHAGGAAHPLTLMEGERSAASHAAQLLAKNGIRLAGVDLIGDQIIELNVFSTGGLYDANQFAGVDFTEIIADRFLGPLLVSVDAN